MEDAPSFAHRFCAGERCGLKGPAIRSSSRQRRAKDGGGGGSRTPNKPSPVLGETDVDSLRASLTSGIAPDPLCRNHIAAPARTCSQSPSLLVETDARAQLRAQENCLPKDLVELLTAWRRLPDHLKQAVRSILQSAPPIAPSSATPKGRTQITAAPTRSPRPVGKHAHPKNRTP